MPSTPPPPIAQLDTAGIARARVANPRERAYGAKGDLQSISTAGLTADSAVVTAPPGTFRAKDVGKVIWTSATPDNQTPRTAADVTIAKGLSFSATCSVPAGLPNVPRGVMTHLATLGGLVSPTYYANVLTSTSGLAFTQADRWRFISVAGATAAGSLDTQILYVLNATTAITVDPATVPVGPTGSATIWGVRSVTDGATGAYTPYLSSGQAQWSPYDIGAWVRVPNGGGTGITFFAQITGIDVFTSRAILSAPVPATVASATCLISTWSPLVSTIVSVAPDGSSATMAVAAFATVTGATVWWGTDDTLAVQRAVDSGLDVEIPVGNYLVNILAIDNVYGRTGYFCQIARNNFRMSGRGARFTLGGGNPRDCSGIEVGDSWTGYHDILIDGLTLDGNHQDGTNAPTLVLAGTGHVIPSQTGGAPIWSQSDFNGAINCRGQYMPWGVVPNVQTVVGAGRPGQLATERVTVTNCQFYGWSKSAFTGLSYADYLTVTNCLFDGGNRWSNNIHVDGTRGMRIERNIMRNCVAIAQNPSFVSLLVNGDMGYRPFWDGVVSDNIFDNLQNGQCLAIGGLHAKVVGNIFSRIAGYAIGTSNYNSQFPPPTANGVEFGAKDVLIEGNTFEEGANGVLILGWNSGASGVTATPIVSGGKVTGVTVPSGIPGTRVPPMLVVIGDGAGAQISPTMATGMVGQVQFASFGSGYYAPVGTPAATCTFSPPPSGVTATGTVAVLNGVITSVNITNPGSGYTSPPTCTIIPYASSGVVPAVVSRVTLFGQLHQITITKPGAGYTLPPVVTFSPAPTGGVTATGIAVIAGGAVTGVNIVNPGGGYTSAPTCTIAPPPSGTQATVSSVQLAGGSVTGVTMGTGGSGYPAPVASFVGGGGSGAALTLTVGPGWVTDLQLLAGGVGYDITNPPTVVFNGGGGTGAMASVVIDPISTAIIGFHDLSGGTGYTSTPTISFSPGTTNAPGSGAVAVATTVPAGAIVGTSITNYGMGYTSSPLVQITDPTPGAIAAQATINAVIEGSVLSGASVVNQGNGYNTTQISIVDTAAKGGSGYKLQAMVSGGQVTAVNVLNGGTGFTAAPTIQFNNTGTGGTGAAATATVVGGAITAITMTNNGSGYTTGVVPLVSAGGYGAVAVPAVTGGVLTAANLPAGGFGYQQATTSVTVTGDGGRNSAVVVPNPYGASGWPATGDPRSPQAADPTTGANPGLVGLSLNNGGSGYAGLPAIVAISGGYHLGSGATGTAVVNTAGQVTGITLTSGAGYTTTPSVAFVGGGGTNAQATATISGGSVVGLAMTNNGQNYTSAPDVVISGGGGVGARAICTINTATGGVNAIYLVSGGDYLTPPIVQLLDPNGSGATAIALLGNNVASPPSEVNLPGGVTGYRVLSGGSGYSQSTPPTVVTMPFPASNSGTCTIQNNQFITNPYVKKTSLRANFATNPPTYYKPDDIGPGLPSISTYWYGSSTALTFSPNTWSSRVIFRGNYLEGYYTPGSPNTGVIINDVSNGRNFYLDNIYADPMIGIGTFTYNPLSVERGSVFLAADIVGVAAPGVGFEVGRSGTPLRAAGASAITTWAINTTVASGASVTLTVGVPGIVAGDEVTVTLVGVGPPNGCTLSVQATAGNSATVTLTNTTGAGIAVGTLTFRVAGRSWAA